MTCKLAVVDENSQGSQRGQKIIVNQSKPVLDIVLIKPFTCRSFSENYFSREIEWVVFKERTSYSGLPLTRALLEGFFLRFKSAAWWTSINRYHGFHALAKRRFFPCFSSTRKNMSAFEPF